MLEAELKMDTESKKKLQAQMAFSEQVRRTGALVDTLSCQYCFCIFQRLGNTVACTVSHMLGLFRFMEVRVKMNP